MPIKISEKLPAKDILLNENIFIMTDIKANSQDIRALKIAILNLMPTKIKTETQLLRLLSNTPLQIEIDLIQTQTHTSKNTPTEHLLEFYKTFSDIKNNKYDGLIITGAPVEHLKFEEVDYWEELCSIFSWAKHNVFSTLSICWAAQAALYFDYSVQKLPLSQKLFGIFQHKVLNPYHPLLRGFDQTFMAPHSRHTEVSIDDINAVPQLELLVSSDEAGAYIIGNKNQRDFYITGHSEYDADTLADEYFRDLNKGLEIEVPKNYFPKDNPKESPPNIWRGHAHLLFMNWLNYFVYQETPYNLNYIFRKKLKQDKTRKE